MNEFDNIAKKLWHRDGEMIKLLESLTDNDRMHVEQRLLSLYAVSIDLSGTTEEIKTALDKARSGMTLG